MLKKISKNIAIAIGVCAFFGALLCAVVALELGS
jgi:hypothetical protein